MTKYTELDGLVALVVASAEYASALGAELVAAGAGVAVAETDLSSTADDDKWIARLDARDDASLRGLAGEVVGIAGRVDILVQHHATSSRVSASEVADGAWAHDLSRVTAALNTARGFAAVAGPNSAIVSLVSMDASASSPLRTSAATVSAALEGLTRSLAVEWATIPIRVNAVAHGVLLTEAERDAIEVGARSLERVLLRAPSHRLGDVAELAALVRFLVGPGSEFITGQRIAADGGWAALTQHPEGLRFP